MCMEKPWKSTEQQDTEDGNGRQSISSIAQKFPSSIFLQRQAETERREKQPQNFFEQCLICAYGWILFL